LLGHLVAHVSVREAICSKGRIDGFHISRHACKGAFLQLLLLALHCPAVQMSPYEKRQAELERRRELLREA
jgi:hypothetical protein